MEVLKKMTDTELVLRISTTEGTAAFTEIYNRYYAQLFSATRKRILSDEIAEEIVQDLFINLWRNRNSLTINSALNVYLFTAVRNLIINQVQKEAVRKKHQAFYGIEQLEFDNSTEETVMVNDLVHHLYNKITLLPNKCRSVFELSRKQHKSNKQIADELGISEKTVENHITRAIKSIRISLQHITTVLLFLFFWP